MIRVCPYCSNINVDKLKKTIGEENVKTGCIGACRSFSKEAVGKINGELTTSKEIEKFKWYTTNEGTDILSNTLKNEVVPYCLENNLID